MASINDEKLKMMEDEMNRFEEEIGLPNLPKPSRPVGSSPSNRQVIGTNTYDQVQRHLNEIDPMLPDHQRPMGPPESLGPPIPPPLGVIPPPPPPPMFIPQQVRMGPGPGPGPGPMRPPMPGQGNDGGPGMNFGPGPGPMGPFPGPMGPMGFGPPGPMGPPGMGPPPGMVPPGMCPPAPPGIAPSGPPGPMPPPGFNGPPGGMMGPGPPRFMSPPDFGPPPVPPQVPTSQAQVVVSATPKLYSSKTGSSDTNGSAVHPNIGVAEMPQELQSPNDSTKKQNKKAKSNNAKEMAEKVKATAVVSVSTEPTSSGNTKKKEKKNKKFIRTSGGISWEDPSLCEWEEDDFRLFCGDLGNDVTDEVLTRAFSKYSSFLKAKVIRDKRTNKTKGFGFVSFKDPQDFIRATKEMNGRYVGSRPIKLRKSMWRNRSLEVVRKKDKEKAALIGLLTGR